MYDKYIMINWAELGKRDNCLASRQRVSFLELLRHAGCNNIKCVSLWCLNRFVTKQHNV